MLRWYPGVLLRVVLELTFVPIAFLTIFAVMVLADPGTPWAIGSWRGPGPTPDFGKTVALLALGWTLLALGWRGARSLFRWLIVLWHFGLTTASFLFVIGVEDPAVQGEAIGFRLSLGLLAPAFSLTALVCSLVWLSGERGREASRRSVSPLQRRNKLAAGGAVAAVAVAVIAFAFDLDGVGSLAGFAATLAVHEVLRPLNPSAELHKALVLEGSAPE